MRRPFWTPWFVVGIFLGLLPLATFHAGRAIVPLEAQGSFSTVSVLETYDYEAITVGTTATRFTVLKLNPTTPVQPSAKAVFCTTETSSIRFREDGTSPTASEGHLITSGSSFTVFGINNLNKWRVIRDTGASSDATLRCSYRR